MKLNAGAFDAVKRRVMRFAAETEVLSPHELFDMIRSEAEAVREVRQMGLTKREFEGEYLMDKILPDSVCRIISLK